MPEDISNPITPTHYKGDQVMTIIEDFKLGFCLGNVVKYILRHKNKAGVQDVEKARWYINRHIGDDHKDVELDSIIARCQAPDAISPLRENQIVTPKPAKKKKWRLRKAKK